MLFTSYFAKSKALKEAGIVEVSISRSVPAWYNGLSYTKLAPTWEILKKYKADGDWNAYVTEYKRQVLSKLDAHQVYAEITKLVEDYTGHKFQHVALLCFERSGNNCHRNIVSDWFFENGIICKEWSSAL